MKVKVTVESTDASGEVIKSSNNALLEDRGKDYKISYVELLSEDTKEKTKTTMYVTSTSVRIIRDGEIKSDFMYAEGLTHNSLYQTPYGSLPVEVITRSFNFVGQKMTQSEGLFERYPGIINNTSAISMDIEIEYQMIMQGAEPMDLKVRICVE